jgi:hypothetical protein
VKIMTWRLPALLLAALLLGACAPTTFVRTMEPNWNTIEIRKGLSGDDAWDAVVDLAARRFDIEVLSKEDGYLRTGWSYSWTGKLNDYYKVRAVVKFSPDKDQVEIKTEAHYYSQGILGIGQGWQMGTDERLTSTMRTDVMGKVGRTTR